MDYILLIGGNGFIGSNLVEAFLNKKYKVIIFAPIIGESSYKNESIIEVEGELKDTHLIEKVFIDYKISIVIHLVSGLLPSSNNNDYMHEVDGVIKPTIVMLDLMNKYSIRQLIYLSSGGTVYGTYKDSGIYSEYDERCPISYYGLSKLQIEDIILYNNRINDLKYLIIRPSNPFGKHQNINGKQGIIPVTLGKIINHKEIEIWGDGETIRDYIPIEYLSNSIVELVEKQIWNEILNIGSGVGYSTNRIIEIIKSYTGTTLKTKHLESNRADVDKSILDISKIKSLIEIETINLEKSIQNYCDEVLKNIVN